MITNRNISLRAPEPSDVTIMYAWENDRSNWRHGRTRAPLSMHQLDEYVRDYNPDILAAAQGRFMIVDNATGKSVGAIDLYDVDAINRRAAVGIVIDSAVRQKGFAADALNALADYASIDLGLHQLWAIVAADNLPAKALFTASGYDISGRLRSWVRINGQSYSDAFIYQKLLP